MKKILIFSCILTFTACSGVKKAPQPKMENLINVNQTIPSELQGKVPLNNG